MVKSNLIIASIVVFFLFFTFENTVVAQVGINEPNPQQTLDVGGRIEVADDLNAANTLGSIKFDEGKKDLEGFTGEGWKSLTSGSSIPSNAIFVTARESSMDNNSNFVNLVWEDESGNALVNSAVPAGKYILVTSISITPSNLFDIDVEDPFYRFAFNFGGNSFLEVTGKYTGGILYLNNAGYAPLAVVNSGVVARAVSYQLTNSFEQFDSGVDVLIGGFLVDDLDFD